MPEEINEHERLGRLQFSKEEVELITGEPLQQLPYRRGQLKAQAEVRQKVLELAQQGSSPAQKQFLALCQGEGKRTKAEADALLNWSLGDHNDYRAGVRDTIQWFRGKQSPTELE